MTYRISLDDTAVGCRFYYSEVPGIRRNILEKRSTSSFAGRYRLKLEIPDDHRDGFRSGDIGCRFHKARVCSRAIAVAGQPFHPAGVFHEARVPLFTLDF